MFFFLHVYEGNHTRKKADPKIYAKLVQLGLEEVASVFGNNITYDKSIRTNPLNSNLSLSVMVY